MKLRPHHALCVRFFEGKGYSAEFTKNMSSVIDSLEKYGTQVELTLTADVICARCPHNCRGVCEDSEKVDRYDSEVLRRTGLHEGDVILWKDLGIAVRQTILEPGALCEICGECRWYGICGRKKG